MRRSDRERQAYDNAHSNLQRKPWLHRFFPHIFTGPNAHHGEELFFRTVKERAQGANVLELGCGSGGIAARLIKETDATVLGTDISAYQIGLAKTRWATNRLEFRELNAEDPIDGQYDLIYGRAVLHHIDFRSVLERLSADNLKDGGAMVFREPLAGTVMGGFYRLVSRDDHTEDERPISRADLQWLKKTFPGFWLHPYGLTSVPL